jgi:hypothetical protein
MTALYLIFSVLAGLGFYLGTRHQRLWPAAQARHARWRALAWLCSGAATASAIAVLGLWAGVFAALTAVMLVMVLLPYLDAWRALRAEARVQSVAKASPGGSPDVG